MDSTFSLDPAFGSDLGNQVGTAAATGIWAVFAGVWAIVLILAALGLIFWIWALVDVSKRQFTNQSDKTLWLVLLIVSFFLGLHLLMAIIYLIVARKKGTMPGAAK